ncbi:MAG: enoyl-CoA hydratase-related protein, partial [Actinomycetota bacterium]
RVVGISHAAEWVYTGRILSAQEALDGGLVRALHAPDDLLPAARTLAREIADNTSGVSVALSRQMLWRMLGASHPMDAHRADSRGIQLRGRSGDDHEGVTSFLEKRAAKFTDSVSSDLPDIFPDWEDPSFS